MQPSELSPVLEIKSIEDTGTFTGYASVFQVTDSHKERTVPGCFVPSLADHKRAGTSVKMFWQHDPREPIGKWVDLAEDSKGLWVQGKLNMAVQRAREAHALLKERDIDGLSIGYYPEEYEEDKHRPGVTLLKRVRLVEVSIVSMGSNRAALVNSVKSEAWTVLRQKLMSGELPSERELERGLREALDLSRSQAETAVRLIRKSPGEPGEPRNATKPEVLRELRALVGGFKV